MTTGRIVGIILIVVGLVICLACSLTMCAGTTTNLFPQSGVAGAILALVLFGIVPFLILSGVGMFLFIKGGQEAAEMQDVRKKERLLGMIQAAGKISLANAAIELKMTRDQVTNAILELVNQGLFSGYINWQEQMFYSKDLSQMQTTKCPNCGGEREAVGKGLVKCPYCGVELFLPQS